MLANVSKEMCVGCSACSSVCPQKCITMQADEEGFFYPEVSNKCVNCGKCEKICPALSKPNIKNMDKKEVIALVSKNQKIWQRSTSGGAFSEICNLYGDEKTIVVGSEWNGLFVQRKCVEGVNNISSLCKSKYIYSNPLETFSEIKDFLSRGKKVIFCGTPCQVAGLRKFLQYDYENLLLIDLICHGVSSQKVFLECVKQLERELNSKIISYEFRAKKKFFITHYMSSVVLSNGKVKYLYNDPIMQLFFSQCCLRPSCGENCKYRDENRQGDITIADCKELNELGISDKLYGKNFSTVISNSEKGKSIIEGLSSVADIYLSDINLVKKYNPLYWRQTIPAVKRKEFFSAFITDSDMAIKKYANTPFGLVKSSFLRSIFNYLPFGIKKYLLKLKRRYQ